MDVDRKKHKLVGKQILYQNGSRWLVRETLSTVNKADKRYKALKKERKLKEK